MADDRDQQIVEVVGDATGEHADGLHLLDLPQLVFESSFACDVPLDGHMVTDVARVILDRRHRRIHEQGRAIAPAYVHPTRPHFACIDPVCDVLIGLGALLFMAQQAPVAPEELGAVVAGEPLQRGVDVANHPFRVGHHHGVGDLLDRRRQTPLAFLGDNARRHVADHADDARRLARLVE